MKKPVEELLAVVIALAILGLVGMAFVSFVSTSGSFEDQVHADGGGEQAVAPPGP